MAKIRRTRQKRSNKKIRRSLGGGRTIRGGMHRPQNTMYGPQRWSGKEQCSRLDENCCEGCDPLRPFTAIGNAIAGLKLDRALKGLTPEQRRLYNERKDF